MKFKCNQMMQFYKLQVLRYIALSLETGWIL